MSRWVKGLAFSSIFVAGLFFLFGCAGPKATVKSGPLQKVRVRYDPRAYNHFTNGEIAFRLGDYATAISEFQQALAYDPASDEIRESLARVLVHANQYAQAATTAESIANKTADVWLLLGESYRNLNQRSQAIEAYRKVTASDPENAQAWWYLSLLYHQEGDLAKAEEAAGKVWRLRPNHYYLEQYLSILLEEKKIGAAITLLQKVIADDSTDYDAKLRLAEVYENADSTQAALELYRQVLGRMANRKQGEYKIGQLYLGNDQFAQADSVFASLLAGDSSNFGAAVYYAWCALAQNHYADAEGRFKRVVALSDSAYQGYSGLARVYLAQDSAAKAVPLLRQGLGKAPEHPELNYFLGRAFAALKQYDSAVAAFRAAQAKEPNSQRVLFSLGSAFERGGQFDSAVAVFEEFLKLYPDDPGANNYLGYMLAEKGIRLPDAKAMIAKALAKEPENGAYLDSYGWVLFRLGQLSDAESWLRKAVEKLDTLAVMRSDNAVIFDHLGDVLSLLGKTDEAKKQWERALALDPNNEKIREKLAR